MSIAQAKSFFGGVDHWSIYKKMELWKWKGTLENAFRKLYV
jgi:hypothetical protein